MVEFGHGYLEFHRLTLPDSNLNGPSAHTPNTLSGVQRLGCRSEPSDSEASLGFRGQFRSVLYFDGDHSFDQTGNVVLNPFEYEI